MKRKIVRKYKWEDWSHDFDKAPKLGPEEWLKKMYEISKKTGVKDIIKLSR